MAKIITEATPWGAYDRKPSHCLPFSTGYTVRERFRVIGIG
ncbi:MAG TPA: hypothetical protein VFZ08_11495 [Terriglobia bacterium]|nr:hypothetical protein [Terriglobia bacterium]